MSDTAQDREPVAWSCRVPRTGREMMAETPDREARLEEIRKHLAWGYTVDEDDVRWLLSEIARLRARQREGEREPETSQFLRDTLPRNWNYRIHVRGVGGVTVRAWDYEVPETEEYVAEVTQVDPRETRDNRDLLAQIRLGLERIATKRALDTEPPADDD